MNIFLQELLIKIGGGEVDPRRLDVIKDPPEILALDGRALRPDTLRDHEIITGYVAPGCGHA